MGERQILYQNNEWISGKGAPLGELKNTSMWSNLGPQ